MSYFSYEPPAYLVEYLNEIAKREGFIEHSLNFEQGSNHGDGFIANVIAVFIKGKQMVDIQEDKELSLMCKLLPENKARRELFNSTAMFDREVYVYNEILPLFEKFQIEKHISMDEGFFNYPKCYVAVSDANKGHYVIIMDNFKAVGYELWDKMKPVDFDTSSILLASLGRLHGLSFALRDQKPELFQKLQDMEDVLTILMESPSIVAMMMGSIDKAINILIGEDEINLLKKIRDNLKTLIAKFFTNGTCRIFSHGDCWNNNFCFSSDENKKPNKVCLFDWQVSSVMSPAMDFSYYFLSSTTKELRSHYQELLKVYHNSLSTFVTKLGSDSSKLFPFEELENQLKQFGAYGAIMVPILLQIIVSDPKNITDMNSINKDTQAGDFDFATLDDSSIVTYRQRVSDALQDAIRFGWTDDL